ncbi:MAG TPA: hypothetical protein VFP54_07795 [Acidimicrobiales bacterium]|nr:hypothetical protein [Acidimicrobiales bacterium]
MIDALPVVRTDEVLRARERLSLGWRPSSGALADAMIRCGQESLVGSL